MVDTILGFKVLHVYEVFYKPSDIILCSPVYGETEWTSGNMCKIVEARNKSPINTPLASIHAAFNIDTTLDYFGNHNPRVLTVIEGWENTYIGEKGFTCEKAKIKGIIGTNMFFNYLDPYLHKLIDNAQYTIYTYMCARNEFFNSMSDKLPPVSNYYRKNVQINVTMGKLLAAQFMTASIEINEAVNMVEKSRYEFTRSAKR